MSDHNDLSDLMQGFEAALREAYARGFKAGGNAVREAIFAAASGPIYSQGASTATGGLSEALAENAAARLRGTSALQAIASVRERAHGRAPRGLVADTVRRVLTDEPGLSITEIEDRALAMEPTLSSKSIGNELRRREGDAYFREGKYAWFLKGQEPERKQVAQDDLDDLLS